MEELGCDRILFLGDTMDPMNEETLAAIKCIFASVQIPCHSVIGNHEICGPCSAADFYREFGLPSSGDYVIEANGFVIICLATPDQSCLAQGSPQMRWLENQLVRFSDRNIFLTAHFSLLLHPCVRGWKNDGMQQLYEPQPVLDLLARFPNVRAWFAGHKNIPSKIVHEGVLHLLSPQLIQAPCSYAIIDIHEDAIVHATHEIEEQHWLQISRDAYGTDYPERHGREEDRNFTWFFD